MTYNLVPNSSKKLYCKCCDYTTSRLSQYDRHLLTSKHKNTYDILTKTPNIVLNNVKIYECKCGKNYKHRQSLHNHQIH